MFRGIALPALCRIFTATNKRHYQWNAKNNIHAEVPFEKENILFLDDAIENIDMALNVGIKAKQVNGYDLDYIKSCVNEFLNE